MKAITTEGLRDVVVALLDDGMSAGALTEKIQRYGYDVRRASVKRMLDALCEDGELSYNVVPFQRNGRWVQGRAYANPANKPVDPSDPFEGLSTINEENE